MLSTTERSVGRVGLLALLTVFQAVLMSCYFAPGSSLVLAEAFAF